MDPHLTKLLDAYLDGGLTPDDKAELEQLLLSSGTARTEFWRRAKLHSVLLSQAGEHWGAKLAHPKVVKFPSRSGRAWWIPAAAAAIVLLSFVGFYVLSDNNPPTIVSGEPEGIPAESAIATVVRSLEAPALPRPGSGLTAGQVYELPRGAFTELSFASGTRALVKGPARFAATSAMELDLQAGVAEMDVPEAAHGFEVITPAGTMRDLGTRFVARAVNDKRSELHVVEGRVEMTAEGADKTKSLGKGEAIAAVDGVLKPIAFNPGKLDEEMEKGRRLAAWRQEQRELINDENVLVYFTFESLRPNAREVPNLSSHPNASQTAGSDTNTTLRTAPGRWPGTKALSFGKESDRIQVRVDGKYAQLTYAAWVRIDDLPNRFNSLFMSEYGPKGEAQWQVARNGTLQLEMFPQPVHSKPGLLRADQKRWVHLATTIDGAAKEARHFVDGREVFRMELERLVPVEFGLATLGAWQYFDFVKLRDELNKDQAWATRHWTGLIDEFLLVARAMSPGEIAELHQVGRPR